jgi:hypothetical protein
MRRYILILILVLLLGTLALFLFQQGYLSFDDRTLAFNLNPQEASRPATPSDEDGIAVYFSHVYDHRSE